MGFVSQPLQQLQPWVVVGQYQRGSVIWKKYFFNAFGEADNRKELVACSCLYGLVQKNHAAMERPMTTTRARRMGWGTRRAWVAET